ncbi:MAG: XTP/dITP diphosphatase [Sarcina sp.]
MKELIIASNNQKKIIELKEILGDFNLNVMSLKDKNINIEVEEDGNTFEENSNKKAIEIVNYLNNKGEKNFIVMADDSGLMVDYLNGEPGVYSARYAGKHGDDQKNNEKLLNELKDINWENRDAKFVCVITAINSELDKIVARGEVLGKIQNKLSGKDGFGYDPLFYIEDFQKTFSEMTSDEKNKISHRGKALAILKEKIEELL